jgi:subtilisin family serine protease
MRHTSSQRFASVAAALTLAWAAGGDVNGKVAEGDGGRLLVRFEEAVPRDVRARAAAFVAGSVTRDYRLVPGLVLIETALDAADALLMLRSLEGVRYVERDAVIAPADVPNDPSFHLQWGARNTGQSILGVPGVINADMDLTDAWDITKGGQNFVIAVVDSGALLTHEDLVANLWTNPGETAGNGVDDDGNGLIDDIHGWDWFDDDNDPADEDGHGTPVAGIIGARGNNGAGVAGVNWRCRLMILRTIGPGGGFVSDAISAIEYAVDKGVRVSNHSWTTQAFVQALYDAIEAAQAADHLVVAAAGNDTTDIDVNPAYPAAFDLGNVLSVSATNNLDELADFSNFGEVSVDLAAPGVGIYSTRRTGAYFNFHGTSAASPNAAGVAALLTARNPGWTWQQVKDRLLDTARPVDALAGTCVTGGVINAYDALKDDATRPSAPDRPMLTALGGGVVSVEWGDNALNESNFIVQRQKRNASGEWVQTRVVGRPDHNVTELEDDPGPGRHRYRVRARNEAGNSPWSPWRTVLVN